MSDMGDMFNTMHKAKQAKKAKNLSESTAILRAHGVNFVSKNGGIHLQIQHICGVIDYWPSTGLWKIPFNARKNRGIKSLLKYLGVEHG